MWHSPDKNFSATKFQIIAISFQQVRGKLQYFFFQARRSFEQRGADIDRAAAAKRAGPNWIEEVSPSTSRTSSGPTPQRSAVIWAKIVS